LRTITTVAGNGTYGYSGDGGAATAAQLSYAFGVAVDSSGNIYIPDLENYVVREVSSGIITTFAGNGIYGYSGDGGPAVSAELNFPQGVTAVTNGFYILDTDNYRVRFVSATDVISSIAGDGFKNYSGDNGPAVRAQIAFPQDVAVLPSGNVLIADTENSAIRQVSSAGIMTTVAGNETYGYSVASSRYSVSGSEPEALDENAHKVVPSSDRAIEEESRYCVIKAASCIVDVSSTSMLSAPVSGEALTPKNRRAPSGERKSELSAAVGLKPVI
jgi:hypothetical protein